VTETLSPQTILEELALLLPPAQLVTGQAADAYLTDQSDGTAAGEPLAVVFPRSTAEVAAVVTLAAANGIPLVPQGARTGLAGGANAITGAIVVNLTRMNRIVSVDKADQTATVEAGVRT